MNQSTFHRSKELDRSFSHCPFHPNEFFVGVCPLCLHERLVTLASLKQSHYNKHRSKQHCTTTSRRGHSFSLTTKFLALGSLLHRLEQRNHKTSSSFDSYQDSFNSGSSSQEDSFISIKFKENGIAFWDKDNKGDKDGTTKKINKTELTKSHVNKSSDTYKTINTSVMEHTKQHGGRGALPWRKRIVHVFDQIRWRTGSNTNTNEKAESHVHVGQQVGRRICSRTAEDAIAFSAGKSLSSTCL